MIHDKLYKLDSKGKLRVYFIEQENDKYRMITGLAAGKQTKSKWTVSEPKNVGRSNQTTAEEQSGLEIAAKYTKKKASGYFTTIEEAEDNPKGLFFEPMTADTWEKVAKKYKAFPMIADPKLDGMRMTIDSKLHPISRKGKDILTVPHIIIELEEFFKLYPDVILDGELYNHEYKEDFNTLMSIARQIKPTEEDLILAEKNLEFHIYDVYFKNSPNKIALNRKHILKSYEELKNLQYVKVVNSVIVDNQAALDIIKEQNLLDGYEGTMTRGPQSIYENKRSRWLLKHKDFITEEFIILDIIEGKGNRSGMAGNIVIDYKGNNVDPGIRGDFSYFKDLLINKDTYIGKLATIRHFGETPDGSLRFPVCIDINRPDL